MFWALAIVPRYSTTKFIACGTPLTVLVKLNPTDGVLVSHGELRAEAGRGAIGVAKRPASAIGGHRCRSKRRNLVD